MSPMPPPDKEIQGLIDLISNTADAFTTALFLAPKPDEPLRLWAYQSLSQKIKKDVSIGPGEGLVGWAYKNMKPVNVSQFDQDTRRLLFYQTDESIKSFMAVPLPEVNGILTVDSKQQYVFTEKSLKILNQFGDILKLSLGRSQQVEEGKRRRESMKFLSQVGEALYRRDKEGRYLNRAAALLRTFTGAQACFLTGLSPENQTKFRLLAQDADQTYNLKQDLFQIDRGLVGWIMKEKKPLILERTRLGSEKSYLFYPDEPFAKFTSFAGLPLIWGGRLLGAVCLSGDESFRIDQISAQALETAADRISAAMEMELLVKRLGDLGRIDSQTGLPHRTEFHRRVNQMFARPPLFPSADLYLILIKLTNIETIINDLGADQAEEILKSAARQLVSETSEDIELGRLDFGVFGLAIPNRLGDEAREIRTRLTEALVQLAVSSDKGRARVHLRIFTARIPRSAGSADALINQGLASLNNPAKASSKTEVEN